MSTVALTDLATVKGQLKIALANAASDTQLTWLINAVSAAISLYCNRNFGSASYTESYDGSGNAMLWLNQRPVTAVASVALNGATLFQRPANQPQAYGWSFDRNKLTLTGGCFTSGFRNVTVAYTAGLDVGILVTPDLWQAAAALVAQQFKASEHIDKATDQLGPEGGTSYLGKMSWEIKMVLDRYVQVAPANPLGL